MTTSAEPDLVLRFPEKIPLRVVNSRPPCLETPWREFREDLTPNEAFFVRWHLEVIPTTVDVSTWRLKVAGHIERPLEWSLADLRGMKSTSLVAVNQCSGNSRSLFAPRVPGGQWFNGAMGNARWTGVPLRDLLDKAGLKAGSVQVTFQGLDKGPLPSVPDFVKALAVDHCDQPEVLVAYAMNDAPLPLLNGFPVRLVVPGWYATYWVKSLSTITVLPHAFDGYWMAKAYKIPVAPNGVETPDHLAEQTVPINRMNVRSFFTTPDPDATLPLGQPCSLDGIAFDEGKGIRQVDVSADSGRTWQAAELGRDLGNYSFRRWRLTWTPSERGDVRLQVRATNGAGEVQPATAGWNRGGYMRNVIEELPVKVV
jgi:sulfite dehydrogenase